MKWSTLFLFAFLVAAPSAAADGPMPCGEFRTSWSSALRKLGLVPSSPEFGAPNKDGVEPVQGVAGIEGRLLCREGIVGQLGLRAVDDATKLEQAVATVLIALDRDMSVDDATSIATALRAESQGPKKEAMSPWGPYELSWSARDAAGGRFVLNLPEN